MKKIKNGYSEEANKSLSYLIDSKEQETTDDLSWNEITYSVMIKLDSNIDLIASLSKISIV